MDAAAELAQLRARLLELAVEEVEQLGCSSGRAGADCPYGHVDVREPSLDAVVQPAGDASALFVARGHDALARGTKLDDAEPTPRHVVDRWRASTPRPPARRRRACWSSSSDSSCTRAAMRCPSRSTAVVARPVPGRGKRERVAVEVDVPAAVGQPVADGQGSGRRGRGRERAARSPIAGPARARPRGPSRCRARAARAPRPRRATGQRPQDPPRRRRAPCACTPP